MSKSAVRPVIATVTGGMLAVALSLPVQATKLNAKPLPRNFSSNWDRPTKDFGASDTQNQREPTPPSLWAGRRADYRDDAKQKKEDEEKRNAAEKARTEKARQDQINAAAKTKQQAIDANNLGVSLGRQGKWPEAIAQAELSVKIDPTNEEFRKNLSAARCEFGKLRLSKGDVSGAAHMFRKSLAARSDNAQAGAGLTAAIKKMGLDPTVGDNRIGLGDQLQAQGDLESAFIEYQMGAQADPSALTYTKMGDIYMRFGQIQAAQQWFQKALVKDPDFGPAHRGVGYLHIMARDYPSAVTSLRKAVISDPKDAGAGQALVEIWRKQVQAQPSLAENHLGLGAALQLTGDLDGAETEYAQVEQFDRQNAKLAPARASLARARKHREAEKHKEAAETFFNQGLKGEALSEMTQAMMIEPNNSRYQFVMGEYLEAAGNYQAALQAYQKSVIIDPKNEEGARRMRELMSRGQQQHQPQQQHQQHHQQPPHAVQGAAPANNLNPNAGAGFRSHEDAGGAPAQQNQMQFADRREMQPSENTPTSKRDNRNKAAEESPVLKQAAEFELKGDFNSAADVLKKALQANLQSPEIHHRLGLDLLNLGQTEDALSELRIASALDPANKTFADDLARVLRIHQRSMSGSEASP